MHVASLENCKALYEVSGWKTEDFEWYQHNTTDTPNLTYVPGGSDLYGEPVWPAYDLSYLLRKLPVKVVNSYSYLHLSPGAYGDWNTFYINEQIDDAQPIIVESADTPEDAACKLAIELFKQGFLTKLEVADSDE